MTTTRNAELLERAMATYRGPFARAWAVRNDPPRPMPNGVDYTDPRGVLRSNIRAQRAARAYYSR